MSENFKGWDVEIDDKKGIILDERQIRIRNGITDYEYKILHDGQVKKIRKSDPIVKSDVMLLGEHENEVEPQGHCSGYIAENVIEGDLDKDDCYYIPKEEFDELYKNGEFKEGEVHQDTFGMGYGEPYNPDPQAFGKLEEHPNPIVYCQLRGGSDER